jgi:transcription antitermination factor NusG
VENPLHARNGEALSTSLLTGSVVQRGIWEREPDSHWYALYTKPCLEKRVSEHLRNREIEHFLPLYSSVRRWKNGQVVSRECPLFPAYVFVQMSRDERASVLSVPGIVSIVGTSKGATPLPSFEIESLRRGLDRHNATPHPFLTVGERARIRTGSLAGMQGIVLRHKSSTRIVLTLELIMKSVSVEIDAADLEPVRPTFSVHLG